MRVSTGVMSVFAAAAVAFAGCDSPSSPTDATPAVPGLEFARGNDGRIGGEELEVCKSGSAGDFTLSVDDPNAEGLNLFFGTSFSLADGECKLVADKSFGDVEITVTETSAEAGFQFDHVDVTTSSGQDTNDPDGVASTTGPTTSTDPSVTVTISGAQGGFEGALLEYVNVPVTTDGGGEGCTPGYWKQEHHFDSWVGFAPGDDLGAVFAEANGVSLARPERGDAGDLTLLEGLELRGGDVNALLRHAVAALLNASSPGVSYDLSVAEVIAATNAALDGGDVEGTKDDLEDLNEQGCPLD